MKITKFIALALVAVLMFACEKEQVVSDASPEKSTSSLKSAGISNSFIVITKAGKLGNAMDKRIAAANGRVVSTIPEIGLALVSSDDPDFVAVASNIKGVDAVVPNLKSQYLDPDDKMESVALDAGNPPESGNDDALFDLQWGHDAIDAPEAWEAGYRGGGVKVGILDSGFDLDHPDLAPNISPLSADFTGEGLEYTLDDPFSHGCHTAGIVGAADNGLGIIGVAPEVELVLIKVLLDEGYGFLYDILNGIIYAALVDVDVINMSIGVSLNKSGSKEDGYNGAAVAWYKNIYSRAITFAYQNGTTVIAAAGNEETDFDHSADLIHLPSGAAHAISISATAPIGWAANPNTNLDVFAYTYSNYGQSAIDFAAPGGNFAFGFVEEGWNPCTVSGVTRPCYVFDFVFSTGSDEAWYWSVGTSMAAPYAAGVAALIIGKNGGDMKPADVKEALKASADDLGKPGNDDFYGQGRVNALNAVMN